MGPKEVASCDCPAEVFEQLVDGYKVGDMSMIAIAHERLDQLGFSVFLNPDGDFSWQED
jgi:hypothetical protein